MSKSQDPNLELPEAIEQSTKHVLEGLSPGASNREGKKHAKSVKLFSSWVIS